MSFNDLHENIDLNKKIIYQLNEEKAHLESKLDLKNRQVPEYRTCPLFRSVQRLSF